MTPDDFNDIMKEVNAEAVAIPYYYGKQVRADVVHRIMKKYIKEEQRDDKEKKDFVERATNVFKQKKGHIFEL